MPPCGIRGPAARNPRRSKDGRRATATIRARALGNSSATNRSSASAAGDRWCSGHGRGEVVRQLPRRRRRGPGSRCRRWSGQEQGGPHLSTRCRPGPPTADNNAAEGEGGPKGRVQTRTPRAWRPGPKKHSSAISLDRLTLEGVGGPMNPGQVFWLVGRRRVPPSHPIVRAVAIAHNRTQRSHLQRRGRAGFHRLPLDQDGECRSSTEKG